MALLLLQSVVITVVFSVLDDDQLCLQGALKLPTLPTVILRRLEAHEDGCDWLSGVHGFEDGVRGVVSVEGGGHSVRVGGVTVQRSGWVSTMAVIGRWAVAIKFFFVHPDIITKRNITGWSVAELWLIGGHYFLVM